jgi:branched-chain amino acid transport system ATP-binding protein
MSEPMLKVAALNAFYGRAHILFDVDLEVGRGEVVALMGRNGAGKSTTMKSVMGLLPRCHGEVRFRGKDIAALPPYRIARMGMGFVPEDRRVNSRC